MEKDLRVSDYFYLNNQEKCGWHNNNILHNTLWFAKEKSYKPDIEYSDCAIKSYRYIPFYNNWGYTNRSGRGKVLKTPEGKDITADLMTGWWNPFKYFLQITKNKGRKKSIEELLETVPKKNDIGVTIEWVQKKNNAEIKDCIALLDFLNVVYTPGNIIPAPINWKGRGIDSWEMKLTEIFKNQNDCSNANTNKWNKHINDIFPGSSREEKLESFIKANKLEMYFKDGNIDSCHIVSFWGEDKPSLFTKATTEQWGNYFRITKELISERNTLIADYWKNRRVSDSVCN